MQSFSTHTIKVIGDWNLEHDQIKNNFTQRDGLLVDNLPDFNVASGVNYKLTGGGTKWSTVGLFYRANYSFKNRCLLFCPNFHCCPAEQLRCHIAWHIGCDFNATPESEVIKILDQHFTRTCGVGCGNIIPQINPKKTIDFIAFRGDDKLKVTSHKVIDEQYASDHLPVVATVGF